MESFKYDKGWHIFLMILSVPFIVGGIWMLTNLPRSAVVLRLFFLFAVLFMLTLALKGLWRLFEMIILSDDSIIKRSPLREIEIPWNRVTKVELYAPWFEDVGLRVISENGEKIVVTKLLRGFGVFCEKVRRYVPEQFEANSRRSQRLGCF
jgi:hypothetical protein